MSQSQQSSVLQSLETVREKVKLRLMKVPEYRAFLAIEKPMAEVADIPDLVAHLQAAKQKILERLTTTQEYRALLTVEKAIKDISDVLDVVGNDAAPGEEELSAIQPAAEMEQSAPAIAVTAPGEHRESSVSNPAGRFSTLGLVEEWRLTALVQELDKEEPRSADQDKAEAEAKVA